MQVGNISMEFSFVLHAWRECNSVSALTQILFAHHQYLFLTPGLIQSIFKHSHEYPELGITPSLATV